ncbi:MAG: SDR family NAD(P)-dependent oxidoreductase [Hyphomicrobiales bacterium]|nr:MAG: SDR family NAD(P)-dependent oxidoreductase [Hyphomicrobiales bacterium]
MNSKPFEGKVAYVTGAGSGMGADIARLLAERGAKISLVGRREETLRKVAAEISEKGGEAQVFAGDVSRIDDVQRTVVETEKHFGALHLAVNNAGVSSAFFDLPDLPEKEWLSTIGINLPASSTV